VSTALTSLGLGGAVTLDATQAVNALVPALRGLTTSPLLGVQSAMAYAGGTCANGAPSLTTDSKLAGITIAGVPVSADKAVSQTLTLLPATSVDFSKIDLTKIVTSSNATALLNALGILPSVKAALQTAISAALAQLTAALPTISVPAVTALVSIAPGQTIRSSNQVTQQALAISASVAGLKVIDAIVGEAVASADGVDCTPPTTPGTTVPTTTTAASLQCTKRRLVLTDVVQRGHRVKLTGVADRKLAGRTVAIVFSATGRTVAHAKVSKGGTFQTTAPLPPASIRNTNAARYVAKVGSERSINLKLRRRMILSSISSRHGTITIVGHVVRPLGRPAAPLVLRRRISCQQMKVVGRFRPRSDGSFRVVVKAPRGPGAAVYRLTTFVRNPGGHRLFSTFTLPRAVELT
jgi:hypothetical protein